MSEPKQRRPGQRGLEFAFGLMALASLAMGLGLYLLGDRFGIEEATGRLIATAFIVAGVLDAAVLFFWERLFSGRS